MTDILVAQVPAYEIVEVDRSLRDVVYVAPSTSGGGGTWGSITGTLADQTDLNTALGLLAPKDSPTFTGPLKAPSIVGTVAPIYFA